MHGDTPKRAAISIKVRQNLRDFLETAAVEAGRSFTQEVESRLEASRQLEHVEASRFFWLLSLIFKDIEEITGGAWNASREGFAMSQAAVAELMRRFGSLGDAAEFKAMLREANSDAERDAVVERFTTRTAQIADIGAALVAEIVAKFAPDLPAVQRLEPHAIIPRGV